jgi:hypothetical protein
MKAKSVSLQYWSLTKTKSGDEQENKTPQRRKRKEHALQSAFVRTEDIIYLFTAGKEKYTPAQ